MSWLTDMEYLDHKTTRKCFCRNLNPNLLSCIMSKSSHRILSNNNTPHATAEEESAYPFRESEFTKVTFLLNLQLSVFCFVNQCLSFVHFLSPCIVFSVLIYGFCLHLWYLQTFVVVVILLNVMYTLLANVQIIYCCYGDCTFLFK